MGRRLLSGSWGFVPEAFTPSEDSPLPVVCDTLILSFGLLDTCQCFTFCTVDYRWKYCFANTKAERCCMFRCMSASLPLLPVTNLNLLYSAHISQRLQPSFPVIYMFALCISICVYSESDSSQITRFDNNFASNFQNGTSELTDAELWHGQSFSSPFDRPFNRPAVPPGKL